MAFLETPQAQQNSSLKLAYKGSDDYGVVKAAAIIRPLDAKGAEIKTAEPLVVELPISGTGNRFPTRSIAISLRMAMQA
jgi:hypothetical protein